MPEPKGSSANIRKYQSAVFSNLLYLKNDLLFTDFCGRTFKVRAAAVSNPAYTRAGGGWRLPKTTTVGLVFTFPSVVAFCFVGVLGFHTLEQIAACDVHPVGAVLRAIVEVDTNDRAAINSRLFYNAVIDIGNHLKRKMLEGCKKIWKFSMKATAAHAVKHTNRHFDSLLPGLGSDKTSAPPVKMQWFATSRTKCIIPGNF